MIQRLLYLVVLLGVAVRASGQVETVWTGDHGPSWFEPQSWSNGIPRANDTASIPMGNVKVQQLGAATSYLKLDGLIEINTDPFHPEMGTGSLSAGLIEVGYLGHGTLKVETGGRVNSTSVTIAPRAGTVGTAEVNGATNVLPGGAEWNNSGNFFVGSGAIGESHATLNILAGGILNCNGEPGAALSSIGAGPGSADVHVSASTWNIKSRLEVGVEGSGMLEIEGHGIVTTGWMAQIGLRQTSGAGLVTLNDSTWTIGDILYVGYDGPGFVAASNNSSLGSAAAYLGESTGSDGEVEIDHSNWDNAGIIFVGDYGQGTLTVHNGGKQTSTFAFIGARDGANGKVTVDQATWETTELYVANGSSSSGVRADGELQITGGGIVNSTNANVGTQESAIGLVSVTGVSLDSTPSTWNITSSYGSITVGNRGTGTLTIDSGALVRCPSVAIARQLPSQGTLNLLGNNAARGVLETGQVMRGPGFGIFNINGGILRATADQTQFLQYFGFGTLILGSEGGSIDTNGRSIATDAPLQGPGSLTKSGLGTLTLTGNSTYGGLTTVAAGKLVVTGSLTGEVLVKGGATLAGGGSTGRVTVEPGGTVSPGNSPGTLTINGDYVQSGGALLRAEIGGAAAGSGYDQLVVSGAANLAGILNLTLVNGFQPMVGDHFTIVSSGTLSGGFSRINSSGFTASANQNGSGLLLTVTSVQPGVPVITSPTDVAGVTGRPFSYQITASGSPTTFGAMDLPAGLTVDSTTGVISGLPSAQGFYNVTVSATNAAGAGSTIVTVTVVAPPPVPLLTVSSVKAHGASGTFSIPLPLSGNPGVECRSGGATGDHTIVFTFTNPLTSVDSVALTGDGEISNSEIGADAHEYVVSLTGVANAQTISVTLTNVTDSLGNQSDTVTVAMGLLLGDTTGNGTVNASDVSLAKLKSGQAVDSANFREDVTVNGSISASDVSSVKLKTGTALPP